MWRSTRRRERPLGGRHRSGGSCSWPAPARRGLRAANWPRFAARAAIPLLADPLSGARRGPAAIAHYDLLLRDPGSPTRTGRSSSSGPATCRPPSRCETGWPGWTPPRSRSTPTASGTTLTACRRRVRAPTARLLDGLSAGEIVRRRSSLAGVLADRRRRGRRGAEPVLGEELTEPLVARRLGEWLDDATTLFVASSMPIRDVELFLPAREDGPRVSVQPRCQRDRRHRLERVRGGRGRAGAGCAPDRRRRAGPRHRRPARRPRGSTCR